MTQASAVFLQGTSGTLIFRCPFPDFYLRLELVEKLLHLPIFVRAARELGWHVAHSDTVWMIECFNHVKNSFGSVAAGHLVLSPRGIPVKQLWRP